MLYVMRPRRRKDLQAVDSIPWTMLDPSFSRASGTKITFTFIT